MRLCGCTVLVCSLMFAPTGCNSEKPSNTSKKAEEAAKKNAEPVTKGIQPSQLVGKWRLVRAGGKPPIELYIKSQEIDIAADGTWTSNVETQPPNFGADRFGGQGTWSLADGVLSYKYSAKGGLLIAGSGTNSGKCAVRLESGKLIVDPDCFMQVQKTGTAKVAGEYER
jgi:hypothetical protein